MPPLYFLNPPPNPFWDFVSGLEDHPFFSGPPGNESRRHGPAAQATSPPESAWASARPQQPPQPEMSEKSRGKQATVEDPPEVDPSTIKPEGNKCAPKEHPFHGRGRWGHAAEGDRDGCRRGRCGPGRGGRGRGGWGGPPPFMFGGHPFMNRPPWAQGSPEHGPRGPPGPHHHPHGPHRRPSPPNQPGAGFDLGQFLNSLGDKLGIDLSGAAEGLGLTADRFMAGKINQEVNFEPRADIFEKKDLYTVHLSLPGAKKSDIGVDYDGEHSVLRVTGVVHRPDVDEQMLKELVVDGRKRETGVFEKAIRLGTKRDPASIDVGAITAKMTDGVLVVKIPKIEQTHQQREVPISADPVAAGEANYEDEYSEKPVIFDAEDQVSVAETDPVEVPSRQEISLLDKDDEAQHNKDAQKQSEGTKEAPKLTEEMGAAKHEDQLPAYTADPKHEDDDWENFSDASGEAEYVKINVN